LDQSRICHSSFEKPEAQRLKMKNFLEIRFFTLRKTDQVFLKESRDVFRKFALFIRP